MNYTILEVEHKSGIPSRKIRFWLDKGLFPHIHKDKNGTRIFSTEDIEWLCWIDLYRNLGMSIKELKYYKSLCDEGDSTLKERLKIIKIQKAKNLAQIKKVKENLLILERKEQFYRERINNRSVNVQSRSFSECKEILLQAQRSKDEKSNG